MKCRFDSKFMKGEKKKYQDPWSEMFLPTVDVESQIQKPIDHPRPTKSMRQNWYRILCNHLYWRNLLLLLKLVLQMHRPLKSSTTRVSATILHPGIEIVCSRSNSNKRNNRLNNKPNNRPNSSRLIWNSFSSNSQGKLRSMFRFSISCNDQCQSMPQFVVQ